MIRRDAPNRFLLIHQHDHALAAGALAGRFGNERFSRPGPLAIVATGLHDCGWPIHDDAPTLSPDGLPLDVFEIGREVALPVWRASADGAEATDPYAGLLTSLHVLSLSIFAMSRAPSQAFDPSDLRDRFDLNKFQHAEIERQEQLRKALGLRTDRPLEHGLAPPRCDAEEDRIRFDFRLLQAMDLISLAACCTVPPVSQTQDVHIAPGGEPLHLSLERDGDDVLVDPWPFDAEEIALDIPARAVEARRYESVEAFRAAHARAVVETISLRVRRPAKRRWFQF